MPAYRTVADAHLGSNDFWLKSLDDRNEAFAAMRHETKHGDGMCFHEEISVIEGGIRGPGFWSAVTYDDIKEVNLSVVWDPPWHPRMISEEARRELGIDDESLED